jgi:RimJ/RimL family protein N-acetyltransferase
VIVEVRAAASSARELIRRWRLDPQLSGFEEESERPGEVIVADGVPVGWLDPHHAYAPAWQEGFGLDVVGEHPWTLDVFVIPEYWGRGIARAAIRAVSERCLAAEATCMVVDVERHNEASCRAFQGAGWTLVETNDDEYLLRYRLGDA